MSIEKPKNTAGVFWIIRFSAFVFQWFLYAIPYVLVAIISVVVLHIAIDYRAFRILLKRFTNKK